MVALAPRTRAVAHLGALLGRTAALAIAAIGGLATHLGAQGPATPVPLPTVTLPQIPLPASTAPPPAATAPPAPPAAATAHHDAIEPPHVAREFRAVWVSGVDSPDWPSRAGLSAADQQAQLRALLDRVAATGLNAIILHVRMGGDAMYPSRRAPWSSTLTGVSGGDPGYDPLAFAIAEAHARGIAVHAWFNPFRAIAPGERGPLAPTHVTRTHPEWIRRYATQTWIDPGIPDARDTVLAEIVDVARRYDIDGVHLDDYFYPYRESVREATRVPERTLLGGIRKRHGQIVYRTVYREHEIDFPDDATFRRYGAGWASRVAWRRANINAFVSAMYTAVHQVKPWLPVGISPFGIWRSGVADGVTGLDAFTEIAADSRLWLTEGWVDYLAPQLFWPLDGVQQRFVVLERWWRDQNPHSRHIWPGLLTSSPWGPQETVAEVKEIREARAGRPDSPGQIHFRYRAFESDGGVASALRNGPYSSFALVPAMPWLEKSAPPAPAAVVLDRDRIHVTPGDSTAVAWWLVQWSDAPDSAATNASTWRDRLLPGTTREITWGELAHRGAPRRVAVTPLDRAGFAGRVVIVTLDDSLPAVRTGG